MTSHNLRKLLLSALAAGLLVAVTIGVTRAADLFDGVNEFHAMGTVGPSTSSCPEGLTGAFRGNHIGTGTYQMCIVGLTPAAPPAAGGAQPAKMPGAEMQKR